MLVIDSDRSEHGLQRKKTVGGRLLHCCCICGKLDIWGDEWSAYCSIRDMDDEKPYPKFCSLKCRQRGGTAANDVTEEMKRKAKDSEWRDPKVAYREQTDQEKYRDAADGQRRRRQPADNSDHHQ